MIPILQQEFKVLLGRIGDWPGDVAVDTAQDLYVVACGLAPGSLIVDVEPGPGKSTILLAAAAARVGAQVKAVADWDNAPPPVRMWFGRAMKLFKMQDVVQACKSLDGGMPDFVLTRGDQHAARSVFGEGLKSGGLLFTLGLHELDGIKPEKTGRQWALWRKP